MTVLFLEKFSENLKKSLLRKMPRMSSKMDLFGNVRFCAKEFAHPDLPFKFPVNEAIVLVYVLLDNGWCSHNMLWDVSTMQWMIVQSKFCRNFKKNACTVVMKNSTIRVLEHFAWVWEKWFTSCFQSAFLNTVIYFVIDIKNLVLSRKSLSDIIEASK